jgi:hypothetical protein
VINVLVVGHYNIFNDLKRRVERAGGHEKLRLIHVGRPESMKSMERGTRIIYVGHPDRCFYERDMREVRDIARVRENVEVTEKDLEDLIEAKLS